MSAPPRRRVVVTDRTFPSLGHEQAAAAAGGATFEAHQCRSADEVAAATAGADVVLVQFAPMTAQAIAGLARGARIVRYGVGFDNVDVAAAARAGVGTAYVPDYCTDEVADHTATLLLTLLRRVSALDASVRAGEWAAVAVMRPTPSFAEASVGFVGFGRIGRAVLERLKPFGFRFLVHDPALPAEAVAALGGEPAADLDDLLARADAVTLHAPSTPATRHLIDAARLKRMRPHAVLVNTARGELVEPEALAVALGDGRLGGAALDVFEAEPLPAASPLRAAPRLLLSPHAAWYSDASIDRLQRLAADEVRRALAGEGARRPVPLPPAG